MHFGAHLDALQAPISMLYRRPSRFITGADLDYYRRPSQSITGAHLDSLPAPISIHYRRPSLLITGAHLDSLLAPISILIYLRRTLPVYPERISK